MIISDRNKFIFIHIPKCAGTSVRSRIEHLDDRNGAYSSRLDEHPELGLLNYVHIPLQTLKDQFPNEYVCVETYRSMAVMRDPSARFVSSVSQYCNRYSDMEMRNHNIKTLRKQVDKLIDAIEEQEVLNPGGRLPAKLIHFQRQHHFTHLDGAQVVQNIVDISQIESVLVDLLGTSELRENDSVKANESRVYRNQSLRILASSVKAAAPGLHRMLTPRVSAWMAERVHAPLKDQFAAVFEDVKVRDFIARYYDFDEILLNEITS
ncbi:Sulfotransferase family [gamma proteobacterium HIMB55]|nr:Sulfotransferase family [gamma proteobacterium HIMB55]